VLIEVIGTLARKGQTAEGTDQDDVILLPATTVQTRLAGRQFIAQILVSATHEAAVEPAKREVAEILREAHGLSPRDEDDFTVKDQRQLAEAAQSATRVMTLLLLVVASVSLLVGGIGIMNIMLVSVTERTREIGLRRALGARKRDVMAQFLIEAIVLSAMGGLIGAVLGVGVARLVGEATGWSTPITAGSILLAMGFSAAVGVFFGWFPARRAAALDPIDALRFQ
jgi:putative ABC transport system permease protein